MIAVVVVGVGTKVGRGLRVEARTHAESCLVRRRRARARDIKTAKEPATPAIVVKLAAKQCCQLLFGSFNISSIGDRDEGNITW